MVYIDKTHDKLFAGAHCTTNSVWCTVNEFGQGVNDDVRAHFNGREDHRRKRVVDNECQVVFFGDLKLRLLG